MGIPGSLDIDRVARSIVKRSGLPRCVVDGHYTNPTIFLFYFIFLVLNNNNNS